MSDPGSEPLKGVYHFCLHTNQCHTPPRNAKLRILHAAGCRLVDVGGAGWRRHEAHHSCKPDNPCWTGKDRRKATHHELIKFASVYEDTLISEARKHAIRQQYFDSWQFTYPNVPCGLTDIELAPIPDHSLDENFPGGVLPAVASSTTLVPLAPPDIPVSTPASTLPLPQTVSIPVLPVASSSGSALIPSMGDNPSLPITTTSPRGISPPTGSPPPAILSSTIHTPVVTPSPSQKVLSLLRQNAFQTQIKTVFPSITGGLIPGYDAKAIPPRPLRVSIIENPEHYLNPKSVAGPFVSQATLDPELFQRFKEAFPSSVWKKGTEVRGQIQCVMPTWLLLATEMIEDKQSWDVSLVSWKEYSQALIFRNEDPRWPLFWEHMDVIIGGLNFEGDFLNSESPYGLETNEIKAYHQSSTLLASRVMIWPSPRELLVVGEKAETHNLLNQCASALGYSHLAIVPLEEEDLGLCASQIEAGEMQGVLKRSFSGWSHHLITPFTKNPQRVIDEALIIQRRYWAVPGLPFDQPRWFCQPFVPQLMYLGELRSFVINGSIYYSVYTTPRNFDSSNVDVTPGQFVRPLDAFSYKEENPTEPENIGWLTCDGNDAKKLDPLAYPGGGFEKFVLDMTGMMALAEEQAYGFVSGLRVFCRCDVSIYRNQETGKYQYVVSEMTRSWSTCLFYPWASPAGMGDLMMAHLASILRHIAQTKFLSGQPPDASAPC